MSEVKFETEKLDAKMLGNADIVVSSSFDPNYPMVSNVCLRSTLITKKGNTIEVFSGDQCVCSIKDSKSDKEVYLYRNFVPMDEPFNHESIKATFNLNDKETDTIMNVARFISNISEVWSNNYREKNDDEKDPNA